MIRLLQSYNDSFVVKTLMLIYRYIGNQVMNSKIVAFSMADLGCYKSKDSGDKYLNEKKQGILNLITHSFLYHFFVEYLNDLPKFDKKMTVSEFWILTSKLMVYGFSFMLPVMFLYKFPYIVVVIALPLYLVLLFNHKTIKKELVIYPLLWVVMIGLASVFSVKPDKSMEVFVGYILFFAVYLSIVNFFNIYDIKILFLAISLSSTFVSLFGIYQYFFADMDQLEAWVDVKLNSLVTARAYGTFGDPNSFAIYLSVVLFIILYRLIVSKNFFQRFVFSGMLMINTVAFLLTLSRSSWIGFIAGFIVIVILVGTKLLPIFLAAGLGSLFIMPGVIFQRIMSVFKSSQDSSMLYRESIWKASIDMIVDYWKAGIGMNYQPFQIVGTQYQMRGVFSLHSHNLYMQWVIEAGVLGAGIFVIMNFVYLLRGLYIVFKSSKYEYKVLAAVGVSILISFLVVGIAEYNFLYLRNVYMYWMGLALIGLTMKEEVINH
jgi:O-antigen ligase